MSLGDTWPVEVVRYLRPDSVRGPLNLVTDHSGRRRESHPLRQLARRSFIYVFDLAACWSFRIRPAGSLLVYDGRARL